MQRKQNVNTEPAIVVSPDNMKAILTLPKDFTCTYDDVIGKLKSVGVVQGIDKEALKSAVENGICDTPIVVANGKPPVDGEDGRYEMLVTSDADMVNFTDISEQLKYDDMVLFEIVNEGQQLANYIPATNGKFGFNIKGQLVNPKKGKDLPPLIGRGINVSEDRKTYKASYNGKLILSEGRIDISKVMVIDCDKETPKNIKFDGDVVIRGKVLEGCHIEASGDVQVESMVERSNIKCGGNLLLKSGIKGGNVSQIEVGGNICSRYFENTNVKAVGNVQAEYLLDTKLECEGKVAVVGEKSTIIGGSTYAFKGVIANNLGSQNEMPTTVSIGLNSKMLNEYNEIVKQLSKKESELKTFKKSKADLLSKYSELQLQDSNTFEKIRLAIDVVQGAIEDLTRQKEDYLKLAADLATREVIVKGKAFPQVKLVIDMKELNIEQGLHQVIFKANMEKIVAYKM